MWKLNAFWLIFCFIMSLPGMANGSVAWCFFWLIIFSVGLMVFAIKSE